ncbi:MAG: hypothetical protein ABIP77_10490 [Candidatus Limnocylindrales bacterium]
MQATDEYDVDQRAVELEPGADHSPAPPTLLVFGEEDPATLCVDDTCVPAGVAE